MNYDKLLSIINEILLERAKANCLNENDLDVYYEPLNDAHINYLADSFGINHELLVDKRNFYFTRFVTSLFNSSYTNYMNNIERRKALSKILDSFNFDKFMHNKTSLLERILTDDVLNQISNDGIKESMSQSICDIHRFIKKHFDEMEQYSKMNATNIEDYMKIIDKMIKLNSKKTDKIHGFGIALYSDALKETGIIDIVKPDVHILDFYAKIKGIDTEKIKTNQSLMLELSKFFYDFSRATNESIYKIDKKIWITCSRNPFYLHEKKDYKKMLLDAISMTL